MLYYKEDAYYVSVETYQVRKTTAQFNRNSHRYRHDELPNDCIPAEVTANKNNTKTVRFSSPSSFSNIMLSKDSIEDWSDPMTINLNIINEERVKVVSQTNQIQFSLYLMEAFIIMKVILDLLYLTANFR